MATKYNIPFYDDNDQQWRVDIDLPAYAGDPIEITGVGRVFCQPEWNGDGENAYSPIIHSKVEVQFYNKSGEVDVQELQALSDMEGRLHIYRGAEMWWTGYITADGIQRYLRPNPYPITINATDGLALLKDVPFMGVNNWPVGAGIDVRSPLSFIRECLFREPHLDIVLPIRWTSNVECTAFPGEDAIAGSVEWGALGDAWVDFNGNRRTCNYVLENMLKSFQCRLFQFGGMWHIQRINDVVSGVYDWKQIDTTFGPGQVPVISTGSDDVLVSYPFVNNNQVATVKAAATDVVATYEQYQAENVIPNGGFDRLGPGAGPPIYWGFSSNPGGLSTFDEYESLRPDGTGNSVLLRNPDDGTGSARFALNGGVPIDAHTLFKRMTWGFTILPLKGFEYDSESGFIIWDNYPLRVRMAYNAQWSDGVQQTLYLNRWGFWQPNEPVGGWLYLVGTDYPSDTGTAEFGGVPQRGDVLTAGFQAVPSGETVEYSFVVESATDGDLSATLAAWASEISGATSTSTTISIPDPGAGSWFFAAMATSGKDGVLPGNWIDIRVDQLKMGDVASVVFRGRGGNSEILMPDPGVLDGTQSAATGVLELEFALLEGQRYALDDVYMQVEENHDVYQSRVPDPVKMSNRESVELGISSSFTGFMLSNYMTSYENSGQEFRFTDGTYTGSLTGMTANAMMRFRSKSSEIFNGDLYKGAANWLFHSIYQFDGKNLLPLNTKYNIEQCVINVVAIECRDDVGATLVEEHYGSNDLILSNR